MTTQSALCFVDSPPHCSGCSGVPYRTGHCAYCKEALLKNIVFAVTVKKSTHDTIFFGCYDFPFKLAGFYGTNRLHDLIAKNNYSQQRFFGTRATFFTVDVAMSPLSACGLVLNDK